MGVATYVVIGLQIVLSLILIIVVLFQSGSQRGLSGSIAGGAETFFGKNKGRTIDSKLKKWTNIVAILFLASSIALSLLIQNDTAKKDAATKAAQQTQQQQAGQQQLPIGGDAQPAPQPEAQPQPEQKPATDAQPKAQGE